MNRRDFLKNSGIIAAAATLSPVMTACGNEASDLAGMKNIPDAYETDLLVVGRSRRLLRGRRRRQNGSQDHHH